MKLLSIVFSFRNEEKNLSELIKRTSEIIKKLDNWDYEFIFVNDDSDDNSEKILIDNQKNHNVKIINMSRIFGVGQFVLAGLELTKGADV